MLDSLFSPLLSGIVLIGLVLLAQSLFRRLSPPEKRMKCNDVVGFYLGILGALYGIALAFIMTAAWSNQEETRKIIDQEAQVVASIAFFGRGLPHPFDDNVVGQARGYARTMVDDEWPALEKGLHSTLLNQESARLGVSILRYAPNDARGQDLREQLLTSFDELRSLRGERRVRAEYHIPTAIWVLIVFGALAILGLCFLLDVESHVMHMVQTGLIAAFLIMSLAITWDLQNPFQGFSTVGADPFVHLADDVFMNEDAWRKLDNERPLVPSTPASIKQ